jgi:hypothetical protein
MRFGNGPVYARSQAKVVGIDNESAHAVSLSAGRTAFGDKRELGAVACFHNFFLRGGLVKVVLDLVE